MRIRAGAGVAGRVLATEQPLIVDDLSKVEVASETLRRSGVLSWAGVPLRSEDRVLGVMHVTSRTPGYFSEDDIEVLEVLADPIAAAIDRVQLFEAERTAGLTAELAAERLRSLQRMTAALASAGSADQVCEVILQGVRHRRGGRRRRRWRAGDMDAARGPARSRRRRRAEPPVPGDPARLEPARARQPEGGDADVRRDA